MEDLALVWKYRPAKYVGSDVGYLGKWGVFSAFYDGLRSRNDPLCIKLKCMLPGITNDVGNFETVDQAKIQAEAILKYWIEGLKEKADGKS